MREENQLLERLEKRLYILEGLLVQLAQATWRECGLHFAKHCIDTIEEAKMKEEICIKHTTSAK